MIQDKVKNAIAMNSETGVDENDLDKYKVVIITHELYKRLCKDRIRRSKYIKGRKNLIIDEELSILKTEELSSKTIYEMETILNEISVRLPVDKNESIYMDIDLQKDFNKIIEGIQKEANKHIHKEMKFFYYQDEKSEEKIEMLKKLVEKANFNFEYMEYLKSKHKISVTLQLQQSSFFK
ncbi:hypothetical protein IZY60_14435 [Lutibacter sp. B2]|nr:hypothetical protein [Lutibacter sp. B2]